MSKAPAPEPAHQAFRALHQASAGPARRGYARAAALSAERRREIAVGAARARWRRPRTWTEAQLFAMGYTVVR